MDKLTEQLWTAKVLSVRNVQAPGRKTQDLEGDVTRRPESAAWVSDGPHACLKAWHCQREKNSILSFSAIRTLSPCQTCHMSPSQVVLLAYRVWQGYSHTAPNQTPSPEEEKKKSPPPRSDGLSGRGHQPPQGLGWKSARLGEEGGKGQGLYWETLCRQPTRLTLYTHHCSVCNKAVLELALLNINLSNEALITALVKHLQVHFKQENKWSEHTPEHVNEHKTFFTKVFRYNSPKLKCACLWR